MCSFIVFLSLEQLEVNFKGIVSCLLDSIEAHIPILSYLLFHSFFSSFLPASCYDYTTLTWYSFHIGEEIELTILAFFLPPVSFIIPSLLSLCLTVQTFIHALCPFFLCRVVGLETHWETDEVHCTLIRTSGTSQGITRSLNLHVYGLWEEARAHMGRPVRNQASQAQETQRRFYV